MQKLIDRLGTKPHKYRFQLQFARVQLPPGSGPEHPFHRIVLQRDNKKYSSNYVKLKAGKSTPIDEPINFKATLFFDSKKQGYQEKEFEVLLMRKEQEAEVEVMKVLLAVDRYLNADKIVVLEDGRGHSIELYVTAEKVDRGDRDSDDSSIERVKSTDKRKYVRGYQTTEPVSAKCTFTTNSISRIAEEPLQESKKSIIQLIRFQDDEEEDKQVSQPVPVAIQTPQSQMVKKHKPIFATENRTTSKSPSFRDIVNVNSEKLPVKKLTVLRKHHEPQGSNLTQKPSLVSEQASSNKTSLAYSNSNNHSREEANQAITQPPMLKKNLSEVEQQLTESMLRNSAVLEALRNEQKEQLSKQRIGDSELKSLNAKLGFRCQELEREVQEARQRNTELLNKLKRAQGELRDVKQIRDHLLNQNSELRAKAELVQRQFNKASGAKVGLDTEFERVRKQLKDAQDTTSKQSAQLSELESEKDLLVTKQAEIVRKYQAVFNELSAQRELWDEKRRNFELSQQNFQQCLRQKEQENSLLRNEVKHLEFMMVKPDDHLQDRQKLMLKERLERLLRDLKDEAEENEGIQNILRNEIRLKEKEIEGLNGLIEQIQKQAQQDEQLWYGKEKSLSKALQQKDRRVAELSKQLQKTQLRLQEVSRFVETEKTELVGKMQVLTSQLSRLNDVDQQLAAKQMQHREAEMKLKMTTSECTELKVEVSRLQEHGKKARAQHQQSQRHIKDIESQLVRTNMKMAQMVQAVFEKDPSLAQKLTQLKPPS